ncbi:unnamed protein product [Clonostachys solani]|uniref:G-patch domain-containing protein n=1 Tax=Clonostachys solani TaxID=160281 RepID=A0A9P0EKT2_9HYPO|nr:unnamed protein product [Clonostachys solani]
MAQPPPRGGGLSLYANLLDPKDPPPPSATISSAPIVYGQSKQPGGEPTPRPPADPSLRFQPIRRPQAKQANKPKQSFPKVISKPTGEPAATEPQAAVGAAVPKSTLADWAATEDDEWLYGTGEKRQRGGRKRKKRKQEYQAQTDWEELYDPSKPTNIDEYVRSDEKIDEVRDWKALLYRHRRKPVDSDSSDAEDTGSMPQNRYAPPSFNAFAPPPPSPPRAFPDEKSGEETSSRPTITSQAQDTVPPPPPPAPPRDDFHPPPPPEDSATISRAPVRYTQTTQNQEDEYEDEDMDDRPGLGSSNEPQDDGPRSSRPGQAGFAHRLMSKYGWTRGTGLGADESGIVNPLQVQVEKRRKKADADGGGWAEPGGKGKIVGGKRKQESSKFGAMSEVIVLQDMLENITDLQAEIADGLAQEIGEECGEKYGRVERLYIDQSGRQVFIKFTNQVSALRAVDALAGRVFNGNTINPKFFDVDKFEKGIYQ